MDTKRWFIREQTEGAKMDTAKTWGESKLTTENADLGEKKKKKKGAGNHQGIGGGGFARGRTRQCSTTKHKKKKKKKQASSVERGSGLCKRILTRHQGRT